MAAQQVITSCEDINKQVIRIAVLGATGAGKSSICNLLCGNSEQFEVNDFGFDSKTQEISSTKFVSTINNEEIVYEVIDTPGFFDTQNKSVVDKTIYQMQSFAKDIAKCRQLACNGIDVFLLVIPMGPLTDVHKNTLNYMHKYFDKQASKHIILVISKSKGYSVEKILQNIKHEQKQRKTASNEIMEYLQTIDNRCLVTECGRDDIAKECRENVLNAIRTTHLTNKVMYYGNMWKEFESKYNKLRKQRANYYRIVNTGIFTIVTAITFAVKYRDEFDAWSDEKSVIVSWKNEMDSYIEAISRTGNFYYFINGMAKLIEMKII